MGADTMVSWADDTSSPWWGCSKVSPACTSCYAEGVAARFGRGSWGPQGERALRVEACLSDLARFARRGLREGRPRRVFLGSMCDVFEQRADLVEPRARLWAGLGELSRGPRAEGIRVLVLTKRSREMAEYAEHHGWPSICWAGVTAEDQERADERIPDLLRVPAEVRFVSLRDQCQAAGVPFHWKQWGEWLHIEPTGAPDDGGDLRRVGKQAAGRLLDGHTWDEVPHA